MDRTKENEIYDKFQDLCNSHTEISHYGDKHICNTECPLRDTNRCENVFFYMQGKADGAREFAEWLSNGNTFIRRIGSEEMKTIDELLAEWQKGKEE